MVCLATAPPDRGQRKTRQMKHGPLMEALMAGFEHDDEGTEAECYARSRLMPKGWTSGSTTSNLCVSL
ncbi:Meiosis Inhibitor Protein 1 [Manis pentadactyla]|nr:Meiosis Inhibitor Protein 1 [Manis pentadactyla]